MPKNKYSVKNLKALKVSMNHPVKVSKFKTGLSLIASKLKVSDQRRSLKFESLHISTRANKRFFGENSMFRNPRKPGISQNEQKQQSK